MNSRTRVFFVFLVLCMGIFLLSSQTYAAIPIAKVSSFTGEIFIQSDTSVFRVTQIGQILNDGDRIQTKEGEVQITFNDGALMKIRPFTNTMIQEREEKSGFWIFKTKKLVRRMTVFVGKLWFKSGVSKRKNFLQTPTAVCGVRGSELEAGFDNVESLLNVITGLVDKVGPWKEGPFADPGAAQAFKNKVYTAVAKAQEMMEKAKATGDPEDLAKAQAAALDVVIGAAEVLKTNPDKAVAGEAEKAGDKAKEFKEKIKETGKPIPIIPPTTVETTEETTVLPETTTTTTTTTTTSTTTTVPPETTTTTTSTTTTTETTEESTETGCQ